MIEATEIALKLKLRRLEIELIDCNIEIALIAMKLIEQLID